MSKCLLAIGILTVSIPAFGVTVGVTGQSQTGTKYPSVIKAPYNQVTDLAGSTVRLETGNKNRLINAGFEHSTFSTGWTTAVTGTATITAAVETTSPLEGKKSGKYTCAGGASGGTCTIYQDVTTTQTPQGAAALYVKSDTTWNSLNSTGVQVYSRKDGANFQAKAVDVISDKLFSIPVTLSSITSTGVAAVITVAASQTIIVFLDEGYVGAADLKQDFSPVGPWIDYGAMTITATTTAPTKATTREKDNVRCRVNGQDYECIYEYRAASATGSAIGSGGYIFNLPSGVAIDTNYQYTTTNRNTFSAYDGLKAAASIGFGDIEYTGNGDTGGKCDVFATSSTTFQSDCFFGGTSVWMVSSSEAPVINQTNAGMKFQIKFKGAGLASNYSAYSTTNANYGMTNAGAITITGTTANPTKGTVVTDRVFHARKGQRLIAEYQYEHTTAGTAGTGDYLFSLPNGLSFDTSIVNLYTGDIGGNGALGTGQKALVGYGSIAATNSARGDCSLFAYSATQFRAVCEVAFSAKGMVGTATYAFTNANYGFTFRIDAPASGWDESNIIIGQFNGLESCLTSLSCADTFSADVSSTGVVSNENIDWINGNAVVSNTSTYTLSYNSGIFTVAPNCSVVGYGNGAITWFFDTAITSSQAQPRGFLSGANTAGNFKIICQKAGVDAVFKSARAVSSDQNIATPGVTKAVVFGATINNTTLTNNEGGFITSSSCSSGSYTVNLTGLASVSRCNATVQDAGVLPLSPFNFVKSSSSVTFKTSNNSGTGVCYTVDLTCNGVKQ